MYKSKYFSGLEGHHRGNNERPQSERQSAICCLFSLKLPPSQLSPLLTGRPHSTSAAHQVRMLVTDGNSVWWPWEQFPCPICYRWCQITQRQHRG